jgi:hypothetical protein
LGNNAVPWLQHRADGWNLRGVIGDEMNEHLNANRKNRSWAHQIPAKRWFINT